MAVAELTFANIADLVRLYLGEETEALSRIADSSGSGTTATIQIVANNYSRQISGKLSQVLQQQGLSITEGKVYPDFWRTVGTLTTSSGSSSVTFPTDFDKVISLYDNTHKRSLDTVEEVDKYHVDRLRKKAPGPPEAVEILGVNSTSIWTGSIWPTVDANITPDIAVTYWRVPADMTDDAHTPDAPKNYHMLWVYGTLLELMRPDDPAYERYKERERDMLLELSRMCKAN